MPPGHRERREPRRLRRRSADEGIPPEARGSARPLTVLSDDQDAFGAALLAHVDGTADDRVLLLEVDDGRIMPAMPPSEFFNGPDDWPPWEREVLDGVEGPVLDLGCGAGRHALLLQDAGHRVAGVDNSPGAVEVCTRRGLRDVQKHIVDGRDHAIRLVRT